MATEWSFTVAQAAAPAAKAPSRPRRRRKRNGPVTLHMNIRLEFFPTTDTQTEPESFIEIRYNEVVMPLRELGEGFFRLRLSDIPFTVHPESVDTRGLAERVRSLATTMAVPLQVSLKAVTVMPSADIQRERLIACATGSLQVHVATAEDAGEGKQCAICLEKWGRERVLVTPCMHHFHQSCIFEWMETSLTCPICRYVLPEQSFTNIKKQFNTA